MAVAAGSGCVQDTSDGPAEPPAQPAQSSDSQSSDSSPFVTQVSKESGLYGVAFHKDELGWYVGDVTAGSDAEEAGLKVGDRLRSVGDLTTLNAEALKGLFYGRIRTVPIVLIRAGEPYSTRLVVGGLTAALALNGSDPDLPVECGTGSCNVCCAVGGYAICGGSRYGWVYCDTNGFSCTVTFVCMSY